MTPAGTPAGPGRPPPGRGGGAVSGRPGRERALVLGGGALTGGAWQLGMLLGLQREGVDLTRADVFFGTSAGAVVSVGLAADMEVEQLYVRSLVESPEDATMSEIRFRALTVSLALALLSPNERVTAHRATRLALRANLVSEREAVASARRLLAVPDWPARPLVVPATDTVSGALRCFRAGSGVELYRALAASCAAPGLWPPIRVGGRHCIDGGLNSPANALLARNYRRVVILAPFPSVPFRPSAKAEARTLEEGGSRAVALVPKGDAQFLMLRNPFDPARRPEAARAGLAQAASAVDDAAEVWNA